MLAKKLGTPSAEKQAEMSKKYQGKLAKTSSQTLMASYTLAAKPYGKTIQIAQLQMLADQGHENAKKALKMMMDPKAMAEYEAMQKAKMEAKAAALAKTPTDPAVEKEVVAWMATMKELNTVLKPVNNGDSATKALPKLKKLTIQLEAMSEVFHPGEGRTASIKKHNTEIRKLMFGVLMNCARLGMSTDKEIPAEFKTLITRVMKQVSD